MVFPVSSCWLTANIFSFRDQHFRISHDPFLDSIIAPFHLKDVALFFWRLGSSVSSLTDAQIGMIFLLTYCMWRQTISKPQPWAFHNVSHGRQRKPSDFHVKTGRDLRHGMAWYGMVKNSQWTFHIVPLSPQRSSGLLSWECCVWWATTSSDEFGAGLGWRASSSNGKSQPSPVPPLKLRGLARFFSPLTIQYFIVFSSSPSWNAMKWNRSSRSDLSWSWMDVQRVNTVASIHSAYSNSASAFSLAFKSIGKTQEIRTYFI